MSAKKLLQEFSILYLRTETRLDQLARFQSLAIKTTSAIKGTVSGTKALNSNIESAVVSIYDDMNKLAKEIVQTARVYNEIVFIISEVQNKEEKVLLEMRYLCFLSWKEIAKKMNLSVESVFRLHRNALKSVEEKLQ